MGDFVGTVATQILVFAGHFVVRLLVAAGANAFDHFGFGTSVLVVMAFLLGWFAWRTVRKMAKAKALPSSRPAQF